MIDRSSTPQAGRRRAAGAKPCGAALALAWVLASAPAVAAEDPRPADADKDLVTVTATRIPQPVEDVPATVTVIDAETIADQLASDVKDLVRFEPGVSVRRAPSRFGAAQGVTGRDGNAGFNIRGLEGNRVLIQVDGVRVPDGFEFGAQSAGRGDYVDLGVIKSVEILRGPASALYGSDGLAGAVSFVTSDPQDFLTGGRSFGGIARAGFDSADDQFSETGIVAGAIGSWTAMVAYTGRDGHELDNKGTNAARTANRTAPNPQDTSSNAVLAKLVWSPDDANRVRLTYDHLDGHLRTNVLSGISAAIPVPATGVIGLTASDHTRRDRVSLDWRYTGQGLIESAQITAWYQDGENRQFTAEDRNTAADRTRLNSFENRVYGASAELRSDFATGALSHKLVYGGDVSFTRQKGLRDGTVPTAPDVFPTRAFPVTDYTLAGAYLADEIGIANGVVTLHPALRFDHYSLDPQSDPLLPAFAAAEQAKSRLSPKFGLVARPLAGVSLFANYARGFKAPAPTQVNQFFQNLAQGYTSIPNPDLRPETSETWEAGLKLGAGWIDAAVTGFTGRYRDFISQQVVGGSFTPADPAIFQFINLNRVKIEGVEGKIDARSSIGITGRLAVSYAKGIVTGTGGAKSPLSTIDPVKLVAGLGYDAPDRRFGGQVIATHSAQKPLSATTGVCTGTCFRPGAFTILDATAYVRIGEALTVRAGVFNLFDRKYTWWSDVRGLAASSAVTDAYTQPGRNASVSLTARF
jgi:hemoglobin/transferrin/lactoferrin receptor protein